MEDCKKEEIAKELFAVVCRNGGIIDATDKKLRSLSNEAVTFINEKGYYPLLQTSLRDVLKLEVELPANQATLKVKVAIELCKNYANGECVLADCTRLHVCPSFIKAGCENANCMFNHDVSAEHEQGILRKFHLDLLQEGSLLPLLRNIILGQSDGMIDNLEVCASYNTIQGCPTGYSCLKLHLCISFSTGDCENAASDCGKSHDVLEEKIRLTKNLTALENSLIAQRIINFQNFLNLAKTVALRRAEPPTIDEVCGFHLKGNCRYGPLCKRHWNNLPYIWQITLTMDDGTEKWVHFPAKYNQLIEWDFSDVNKDISLAINISGGQDSVFHIHFEDMLAKTQTGDKTWNIRRLSTTSWVKAAPGDCFGTKWTWYWTNDENQWTPFDGAGREVSSTSHNPSSNEILEEHLLSGAPSFTLPLNGSTYTIDLQQKQQTNTETGRTRRIRRRPTEFVGERRITPLLQSRRQPAVPSQQSPLARPTSHSVTLPQGWTPMSSDQDVSMVTLQRSSPEYLRVEAKFNITLRGKTIHKIERVQNIDLWESYSRKLSKISRKLGRPAEVRDLFHGTGEDAVKAICQQGFDWRMNGAHGTACGKGSYFAVAASYSDGFSGNSRTTGHKMMFLSKVIVGLYVVGNSGTVRPPPRDPSKPYELYHSCVDNQANPTMFVVFENDQAYPEFLISYS